ncbi:sensor histidine kinase [Amnibacterium kyonggiense]|uniref:sensor histidine kinase n=1 Tax=Amnibacterium kyonggiense TaxID=595671 RepID=UPI00105FFC9A|nr:histidine kinase [Amnibacterium kyonggiense]
MTRPVAAGARGPHRVLGSLVLSAALIALVAVTVVRNDLGSSDAATPWRGIAYGLLGIGAVLVVALLRRRGPGPTVAIAGALSLAAWFLNPLPPFALLPFAIAVVLALVADAAVWAVASVALAWTVALTVVFLNAESVDAARGFGTMFLLVLALGAGGFLRSRRVRRAEEERQQAERARAAIEEERLRIARELHDVLAHSLSSITVQAGVGLHLAADRPEAATEALETIRTASREALDEVRGVLGVLRGEDAAPLAPGPDLDALGPLVEEVRRSGARVSLDDRLRPRPAVPVQLAVYRVVQEALTNARRHAPGAAVDIVLDREPGAVTAVVRDRLPGAAPEAPVPGNGLTGMRERATSLGGSLDLRVHDDGLEVALRVPVREDPA